MGSKEYKLTDHLGNVLATVLGKTTGYDNVGGVYKGFYANLSSVTAYYPFGMQIPGRSLSSSFKRFGCNGKENDNEVYGEGNYVDFGARAMDTRIGRWLAIDPLASKYPSLTPYQFANNSPVVLNDPDGKKIVVNNSLTSNSSKFEDAKIILNNYFGIANLVTIQGDNSSC